MLIAIRIISATRGQYSVKLFAVVKEENWVKYRNLAKSAISSGLYESESWIRTDSWEIPFSSIKGVL